MEVVAHPSIEELEQLACQESHVTKHTKLRAMILAKRGWTAEAIAEAFGKARRTIQDWVYAYNQHGLEGLDDQRGGNHHYLSEDQQQQVKAYLDATAEDPEDGVRHAAELIDWIEANLGVSYSLSGIYALLDRLGYSWLAPRPRHPKADRQAQEDFKKKPPNA